MSAANAGFPLSTMHVVSGSILGSGVGRRAAEVHWGVAGRIASAFALTLPAAAGLAAVFYLVTEPFGNGAAGPLVIALLGAVGAAALYHQAQRKERVTRADV